MSKRTTKKPSSARSKSMKVQYVGKHLGSLAGLIPEGQFLDPLGFDKGSSVMPPRDKMLGPPSRQDRFINAIE